MRRTFEVKQRFWEGAIEDFADSDNIDTKKDLYAMKRDAQERFEDTIDARKELKKIPFKKLFAKREADKSLANFQQSNNTFEGMVYMGTNKTNQWRPLQNTYFNNDNK